MEEAIKTRLRLVSASLETLMTSGKDVLKGLQEKSITLEEARVVGSKLKIINDRFISETYNYFQMVNDPCADEVASYTQVQIVAEEMIAEIDARTTGSKPQTTCMETPRTSRLPTIELPKFNGDVLKWHPFWDQFVSNVDSRNISEVDKLLYLQSALEGEAKDVIEGLDITNKNYNIAIETLKERYGKQSIIIDAHYMALYKIKRSGKTVNDCRTTFNEVEKHLRVLKSLGENIEHNHLRVLILEKFPEELVYEIRIKIGSEESIDNIRKALHTIISARESSGRLSKENAENFTTQTLCSSSLNRKRPFNPNRPRHHMTQNKKRNIRCIFCGQPHYNEDCSMTYKNKIEKLGRKCYICFREGHLAKHCQLKKKCVHCSKTHNRALCPIIKRGYKENTIPKPPVASTSTITTTSAMVSSTKQTIVVLQTAIAKVRAKANDLEYAICRTLLDSGSQRSYISSRIAKLLKLKSVEDNYLIVYTFGNNTPKEFYSPVVNLHIETKTKNNRYIQANIIDTITEKIEEIQQPIMQLIPEGKHIRMADDNSEGNRIDLLIGNDYYYSFVHSEKVQLHDDLYIVNSDFGWIVAGRYETSKVNNETVSFITYAEEVTDSPMSNYAVPDPPLRDDNIKKLWELEAIGITDSPKTKRDEEAINNFNDTIIVQSKRYYVKWPWVEYPPTLPDNLGLAHGRLRSLLNRTNKSTLKLYDETIKEQIKLGIVEEISQSNIISNHPVHYLPHHFVLQEDKSTKLRIVYDASAHLKDNNSLNQCLYKGPLMLEDLSGILLRFRRYKYGITADIEKAFLQVGLQDEDRDVTRFLWVKDINKGIADQNIKHLRFCRVPFGVISSPFILAATINYHLNKNGTEIANTIAKNIYVDNLLVSVNKPEEAIDMYNKAKSIFEELSMNIRDWCSNCNSLMNKFQMTVPTEDKTVLGMKWNPDSDKLFIKTDVKKLLRKNVETKKDVLRIIASVYDPCGLVAPLLLSTKLFLQDLWRLKLKWDTKLSEEQIEKWKEIVVAYEEIESFEIPRCYLADNETTAEHDINYELHCFSDSSMVAYSAVVYLRAVADKRITISLIMSKTRLKALKEKEDLKIPKMELLGTLIGCRLLLHVEKTLQLKIEKQVLWTDSQVVLCWMKTDKLLPPFVARRINEIKEHKSLEMRYIPSELNPADVGTRPLKIKLKNTTWISGPTFLKELEVVQFSNEINTSLFSVEGLLNDNNDILEQAEIDVSQETRDSEENIDKNNECESTENETNMGRNESEVIEKETNEVNNIIQLQKEHFPTEYQDKSTNLSRSLQIYKDDNRILRCKGRFQNTNWSVEKKFPILLPKDTDFTFDLINKIHRDNYHVGVPHTLALLREKYWIPKGRSQVQKVISRCPQCIKYGGGPYKLPPMPPLPEERCNYSAAFTYTGIDYMGPLLVTNGDKRWICVFTCLSVRAVHLEVVFSLNTEECLLALRRFISVRGVPVQMTSDNALYFKLLAEVMQSNYCIDNVVKWKFIPELAPWFGGFYERLMGLIKHCMKRTLEKHLLTDQQLITVAKEIEGVLNSRPLTYVGSELEHILTPADFLHIGGPLVTISTDAEVQEPVTETKRKLIECWKRGQKILEEFVKMFTGQYLPSLRERRSMHKEPRVRSERVPKPGDIVQIKSDGNRAVWKVGKIKDVIKGSDGYIRVARVEIRPGEVLTRSVSHLYPLELEDAGVRDSTEISEPGHSDETTKQINQSSSETDNVDVTMTPVDLVGTDEELSNRPRRRSAVKARQLLKVWTAQLIARQY